MLKNLFNRTRKHLKLMRLWVRDFTLWLSWELRWLWGAAFPVAFAYCLVWYGKSPKIHAKTGGLFLEFIGVATVAWGLRETRKLFEKPGALGHFSNWFKRFPKYRRSVHLQAGTGDTIGVSDSVTMNIWRNTKPDDPIEKRVEALEVNLIRVKEELRGTQKDVNQRFSEQGKFLKEEVAGRSASDRRIEEKLEASETGGLHVSAIGLFWLMAGMPLTVFPREIAQLFW